MRIVIQRVTQSEVTIAGRSVGKIGKGMMILLGVEAEDSDADIEWLCGKVARLRIFDDENGVMNLDIQQTGGEVLVVSQFTLMANCSHGNRPDFLESAKPDEANRLYEYFKELAKKELRRVESGIFGADMKVELLNDGPFTIVLDSNDL